jgi:hypothetical protein
MNWTVFAAFGIFVTGAAVALLQLWLRLLDPEIFLKTMMTFGVVLALILAWNLVLRERRDAARLRDTNRLD